MPPSSSNPTRHQAPIDMGERGLKIRSMLRKRSGRPEVEDQQRRARQHGGQRDRARHARRPVVAGDVARRRHEGGARGHAAEPEVGRDLPGPHGRLHHRALDEVELRGPRHRVPVRLGRGVGRVVLVQERPALVLPVVAVQADLRVGPCALPAAGSAGRADRRRRVALPRERSPFALQGSRSLIAGAPSTARRPRPSPRPPARSRPASARRRGRALAVVKAQRGRPPPRTARRRSPASVAGTTCSWIGESASAGRP